MMLHLTMNATNGQDLNGSEEVLRESIFDICILLQILSDSFAKHRGLAACATLMIALSTSICSLHHAIPAIRIVAWCMAKYNMAWYMA